MYLVTHFQKGPYILCFLLNPPLTNSQSIQVIILSNFFVFDQFTLEKIQMKQMMMLPKHPFSQTLLFGLSYRSSPLINPAHSHTHAPLIGANPILHYVGHYSQLDFITKILHNVYPINFEDLKLKARII